jgi:hypothetical protein
MSDALILHTSKEADAFIGESAEEAREIDFDRRY